MKKMILSKLIGINLTARKLFNSLFLVLVLILFATLVSAATCPAGMSGSNTVLAPCLVTNCTQLQNMTLNVSGHYALNNNIDCSDTINWDSGQGFYPIGISSTFTGNFDGQGYNITGLYINRSDIGSDYAGLFSETDGSVIQNVGFIDVTINARRFGVVAGAALNTNITNCFATGYLRVNESVATAAWSGGINGWIENGIIENCYFIGTIDGNNKDWLGGITSNLADAKLIDSYFVGDIDGDMGIGGLVAAAGTSGWDYYANIINSYVIANVSGGMYVGGLLGSSELDMKLNITDSYFIGNVTGTSYTGGLVGSVWDNLSINNTYVIGNITGTSDVGGLVGGSWYGPFYIENVYVIGNIIASGNYVGGLLSGVDELYMENSYFIGNVTGNSYTGGLIGWYGSDSSTPGGNITNCYAIADITATADVGGIAGYDFQGNIIDSYAVGNFSGTGNIGGLVGEKIQGTITDSFSAAIINGGSFIGGLVGDNTGTTIINGYWYNVMGDDADNCYYGGNVNCTVIDNKYYFYNINNQPMIGWSYNPPWDDFCDDNGYPPLESEGLTSVSDCKVYSFPPGCGDIITSDTTLTYNLTGCSGNGLNIGAAGVTLDCNGYTISGSGSSVGVNVSSSNNAVVNNCTIHSFDKGIDVDSSNNVNLTDNTIYNTSVSSVTGGINVNLGSARIVGNNIIDGGYGIFCSYASIHVEDNEISDANDGIYVGSSCGTNQIINNNIHNNSNRGIVTLASTGSHNITENNISGCDTGLVLGDASPKVYHNNIFGNSNLQVYSYASIELSVGGEGNYWGRSSCPVFIAGTDSNNVSVVDSYGYNSSDSWLMMGSPADCCGLGGICGCGHTVIDDYTLTGDLNCDGDALTIGADDVTINCAGNSIIGNGIDGYGIYADGYSGLAITDCVIHDFNIAIVFDNVSSSAITGGEIGPNTQGSWVSGVRLYNGSRDITISGVYMHNNSGSAIYVWDGSDITIDGNNLNRNCGGWAGIFLFNTNRTIIQNNNITNGTGVGILMQGHVLDSQILNNDISYNAEHGIYSIDGSSGNTISGNNLFDNSEMAMFLNNCENHNIQNNVIRCTESGTSMYDGIYLFLNEGSSYSAENNTFSGNEIYNCNTGLGVYFVDYFSAYGEDYHNNQRGMYLGVVGADENTMPEILESDIHDNEDGIYLGNSYAYIENTDFTNNIKTNSGLDVDSNSVAYLNNGDFINNNLYGIDSPGTVYWTLDEDVYCTDNDISISDGWIVPMGGKIIATNCTISVNGDLLNLSGGQIGTYTEYVPAGGSFGGTEYGVEGELHTLGGYPGGDLTVNFYDQNPGGSGFYLSAFGAWINASIDPAPGANLDWWMLKIYYTDAKLAASGLDESKLEIQFYNATSGTWFTEPNQGVDTANNYIWANLTHFSVFGIFGSAPSTPATPTTPSGGITRTGGMVINRYSLGEEPLTVTLSLVDKVEFTVNGEDHRTQLRSIGEDYVILDMVSTITQVRVNLGGTTKVDVNDDRIYDLAVTLIEVNKYSAKLTFEKIAEERPAEEPSIVQVAPAEEEAPPEEELPPEEGFAPEEEKADYISTIIAVLAVVAIMVIIIVGINYYSKKKK